VPLLISSLLPLGRAASSGVPSRDSNSGLPYSKPTRCCLSHAASWATPHPQILFLIYVSWFLLSEHTKYLLSPICFVRYICSHSSDEFLGRCSARYCYRSPYLFAFTHDSRVPVPQMVNLPAVSELKVIHFCTLYYLCTSKKIWYCSCS
jgi:hypothetical protein